MDISLRQLFPHPGEQPIASVYGELDFQPAGKERPYLVLNMVSTLDGRARYKGRSGPISNEADRQLFIRLRSAVDAVMVGANTVSSEHYGPLVRESEIKARRSEQGLSPKPLAAVVSGVLNVDREAPLFGDSESEVVIFTNRDDTLGTVAAKVDYEHHSGSTWPPAEILKVLAERYGVRSLLLEGGPTLVGSLLAGDQLIDELFLTISPELIGGEDPLTIVSGQVPELERRLELISLYEWQSNLFLRYRMR